MLARHLKIGVLKKLLTLGCPIFTNYKDGEIEMLSHTGALLKFQAFLAPLTPCPS